MKPAKFPQVIKRKIGRLNLLDLKGDLVGPWAVRTQQEIHAMIQNDLNSALVINLRSVATIDSLGAKAVVENLIGKSRAGIIKGSLPVMEVIAAHPMRHDLKIIESDESLIHLFGEDMVQGNGTDADKRTFRRIKTAVPFVFSCKVRDEIPLQFRAIITNLSEGGLFAEYIDLDDIPKSQSIISPYELNMLHLEIHPLNELPIEVDGKVIHVKMDGDQVGIGIEFYGISKEAREQIHQLLSVIES